VGVFLIGQQFRFIQGQTVTMTKVVLVKAAESEREEISSHVKNYLNTSKGGKQILQQEIELSVPKKI